MEAPDHPAIPFAFCHDQKNFRLLELPPDLLNVVTSADPPVLRIKSSESAPAHAVLCTDNLAYQIRQVQSSNSIFLTKPAKDNHSNDAASSLDSHLSAIATCKSTLELHPVSGSAIPHLKQCLPLYFSNEDGSRPTPVEGRSKRDVFSNIPLADQESERSWVELMAFELDGVSLRPNAEELRSVWKAIRTAADSQGFDLSQQFLARDAWKEAEEDGCPRELVHALLRKLSGNGSQIETDWMQLDRVKFVRWTGAMVLDRERDRIPGGVSITAFMEAWKDELPESWRAHASLDLLKGAYSQPTPSTIVITDDYDAIEAPAPSESTNNLSGKASLRSRKWHEKFKNARR
ncbi:sister chromatid cohesion protein-like protein Dcc1 [Xylona heveae TC161]|uniref:Sister chromatid cohesion protein-like protein Dcc1 n=1 Tax=Xylona heveae (strain CBS 132557 / TC161) TaxID=1328760 RepID=A0A164ZPV5_XYLHT|nr:sister chromatid cohesion protein-like protein Dcc1 [Xylona heveae TC161]KZF19356.1 sister chromatid cohesion protein-like protein Dcc1 [Xylona heveae TC161]